MTSEREKNRARSVLGKATASLASDAIGAHAANATLDETRPPASVDPTSLWSLVFVQPHLPLFEFAEPGFVKAWLSGSR